MSRNRQALGWGPLDDALGGGLLPGTLTVVAGATGAGKTQLGLRWADAGLRAEGRRGAVCDLTSRGDPQNHADYAARLFDWMLAEWHLRPPTDDDFHRAWDADRPLGEYFRPFASAAAAGRRVTRSDLEEEQWHAWKGDLARIYRGAAGYFYRQFARGCRRVVFDGVEPADRFSESIQFEFFEYIYHHVVRQDDEWAAREWLREKYRAHEADVHAHRYDCSKIGCMYLYTTPHVMLDDLISGPIGQGDVFAGANTIVLMGRVRRGDGGLGRALAVVKHRGSACGDEILPYRITESGPVFD